MEGWGRGVPFGGVAGCAEKWGGREGKGRGAGKEGREGKEWGVWFVYSCGDGGCGCGGGGGGGGCR